MNKKMFVPLLALSLTIFSHDIKTASVNNDEPINVIATDYDGCIIPDLHPFWQLMSVLRILPAKVIGLGLMHNLGTLKDMLLYRRLYDAQGKKLVSHDRYVHYFTEKSSALKPYYYPIIEALSQAQPMYKTIKVLQKEQKKGKLVFVWTNRGPDSLTASLNYVNRKLQEAGEMPFEPDGCFVVGNDASNASPVGKPDPRYYKRAFKHMKDVLVEKDLNPNNIKHLSFIDDRELHVTAFDKWIATIPHIESTSILHTRDDAEFSRIYDAACLS